MISVSLLSLYVKKILKDHDDGMVYVADENGRRRAVHVTIEDTPDGVALVVSSAFVAP